MANGENGNGDTERKRSVRGYARHLIGPLATGGITVIGLLLVDHFTLRTQAAVDAVKEQAASEMMKVKEADLAKEMLALHEADRRQGEWLTKVAETLRSVDANQKVMAANQQNMVQAMADLREMMKNR